MTDEAVDVVEKWYAKQKKTGYPIVILDGTLEKALGVPHFPYSGVIDPDGNLSYAGDSPESALKKALKAAKPGSMWPKKLASSALLLRNGKLGEAWADLQAVKTAGGLNDVELKTHEQFSTYITEASGSMVKRAEELFSQDMIYAALQKAEGIANAKPPMPASEAAAKLIGDMKAVPTYDAELKGGAAFASAVALEESEAYLEAVNAFKDVSKKNVGTKIAEVALKRAESLVRRGMPGYSGVCEKCHKAKKACEKHGKTVKL